MIYSSAYFSQMYSAPKKAYDKAKKLYERAKHDVLNFLPFLEVNRLPKGLMYGAIARIWLDGRQIDVCDDVHGEAFEEAVCHETLHYSNKDASEKDVRFNTKIKLAWDPHYH